MTVERVAGLRLSAVLVVLALVGAACGNSPTPSADDGSDDSTGSGSAAESGADADADEDGAGDSADATATDDPPADELADDETEVAEDEPEPEPEPEPEVGPVTLPLGPDPEGSTDPLETINHLESVLVQAVDGGVSVQFPAMENGGLRVEIADLAQGIDVFCDLFMRGDELTSNCSGFNPATGQFLDAVDNPILDVADGYAFVVPMTVDADYVSISFGGATYMAQTVTFSDAPGFVQIDPSGALVSAVVRTIGIALAAEVFAALL